MNFITPLVKNPSNLEAIEAFLKQYATLEYNEQDLAYELAGRLLECSSIKNVPLQSFGWDNPLFDTLREQQEEEDAFQTTPLEIEEGVLECYRCGSKKTISFQKQTRSADEGSTTFAQCVQCGNKWRHNN